MKVIEQVYSKGDGDFLLDIGGVNKNLAWVIDGATPIKKSKKWDAKCDTKWLVENLNNKLCSLEMENNFQNLNEIVKSCLQDIKTDYLIHSDYIDRAEEPSFAFVAIKKHLENIEFLILGDCYFVLNSEDKTMVETDKKFIEFVSRNRSTIDLSNKEKLGKSLEQIRLRKNSVDGYLIGTLDGYAFDKVQPSYLPSKKCKQLLICSDGFARIVNLYKKIDWSDIFKYKLKNLTAYIRSLEQEDRSNKIFPRIKTSDDIWAIKIEL